MRYEWDERKRAANLTRQVLISWLPRILHGIRPLKQKL